MKLIITINYLLKKSCTCHVILLFILFLPQTILSQNNNTRIKYFTLEDGLSQVSSNDLLLDSSGFVWVATADGLNRFDGKEFKYFKHSELDTLSISGNFVSKLSEDRTGKIWVGTNGDGLNYYDKNLDVFQRINLKYSKQSSNEIISALAIDRKGVIWAASRVSGLHYLKPLENGSFSQGNYFPNEALSGLLIDEQNNIWIGGFTGNIYKINPDHEQSNQKKLELNVEGNVQAFYATDQHLLIGSDMGFFIYDLKSKKIQTYELEESGNFLTKHVVIFSKANNTSVWIGTGSGLYLFDWVNKRVIKKIQYSDSDAFGLSNNGVQALLKLSSNQLLVGTANYLNLIDFEKPYFKNISKDKRGEHLLNDNVIFSIFKDNSDLWIGTSDGGLNLIRNNKTYYFRDGKKKSNSISGSVVRAIVKDEKKRRLWLATSRGLNMIDLNTFDPNNPVFKIFKHDPNNLNTINMDFLKDIALDKMGNLWGATFGHGIFRLKMSDQNEVTITRYKNEKDNQNSLRNNITQCIRVDNKNNIWIGTQGGLTHLTFKANDYNNPQFSNYYKIEDKENSLSHNSIYDILIDSQERIWLGTRNGLNLFLEENNFDSWTEQKQFPNSIVYSVQDDNTGNLWLGTNDGIVKFNPNNRNFTHYGIEDNIQSKEFDIHAKFRDTDGIIYMGGIGGVTYFHPNDLETIDHPQPIYFSQLRIKDQVIKSKDFDGHVLKKSLINTDKLEFRYNQFPFYLQFSSIDFRLNKNIEYGYKLLPNDDEWNMLTDPEIQFLNLPSGAHKLQVNGFSRGKEWEQKPLEITLDILPPWWATWWAYILYTVIAITFADRFYRFQLSRKLALAESVRLADLDQLKSNLYTNITHEFRTPLTVILGMSNTLKSNIQDKELENAEKSIEMIERNGNNLLRLVNELLDLAKLENEKMDLNFVKGDIIPFIKYLSESFHSMADESQIKLTVYAEIDSLIMDYDVDKLSAIIYNLISNAIKFSNKSEGKIIVHINHSIEKEKERLILKIKDNGIGIAKENLPNIFNRFYQVNASESQSVEGTGIGLALTKELVNLMGGNIEVKSELHKGSEFIVELPISRNASISKDQHFVAKPEPLISTAKNNIEIVETFDPNSELPLSLIIEDNHDVAHYLETCLKGKYQTIHSLNGIEGIEIALEKVPDIIICDVMMPGKDGYEVCKTLKTDERTDHIPIIILTAKVTMKDRLIGLSHGADAYLTKPFVKAELFTRLDQLISLRKKMLLKMENSSFSSFLNKKAENPETKFLQKIIEIINQEIDNHEFGSRHLAFKLHLSESQVYRKLKAITNKSTALFIRTVRLQRAKELLQTTDKTISEIAYEVGFNNPSWFSKAFKEEFGFSPSDISK